MKFLKISSVLLTLVIISASALPSKVKWQKLKSSEAKLTAIFPGTFTKKVIEKETGNTYTFTAENNSNNYLVSYTMHDVDMKDVVALQHTSLNAFQESLGGILVNTTDWNIGSKKGLGAIMKSIIGGVEFKCDYRVLINNNIQYQAVVVASSEDYDYSVASKFFASVKIK